MSLLQAILMGLIQGLTEFLPVSSSGHLALFKILFKAETDTGMLFDILLHVGTLAAICIVYYKDIGRLFKEGWGILRDSFMNIVTFFKNQLHKESPQPYQRIVRNSYRKFVMLVTVSTIPTGVIGIVGKDTVTAASEILLIPGIFLVVTAILLFASDRMKDGDKLPRQVRYTNAFSIGIVQGIATLPGISRSGATITACLLNGFRRSFAVKYSFIMSIPAILGALVLEIKDMIGTDIAISGTEIFYYIIGMLIAGIVGYISIKTMLAVVRNKKLTFFAVYCLIVGALSIGGYFYMA